MPKPGEKAVKEYSNPKADAAFSFGCAFSPAFLDLDFGFGSRFWGVKQ